MIFTQDIGVGDEVAIAGDGAETTVHVYWNGVEWVIAEHQIEDGS